jgi:hypothetical protein
MEARYEDSTKGEVNAKVFDKTIHALTYSFVVEQGIDW